MKILKKETTDPFVSVTTLRKLQISDFAIICWLPTLLLAVLRYVFAIKLKLFDFNEDVWQFVFALVVPLPGILGFLLPKVWNLRFKERNTRIVFPVGIFSFFTVFGMIMASQTFLTKQYAPVKVVNRVEDIANYPAARYYQIKNFEVGEYLGGEVIDENRNSRKRRMRLRVFMVVPILSDTSNSKVLYFYGVKFEKTVQKGRRPLTERVQAGNEFAAYAEQQILSYPFKAAQYFEYLPRSADQEYYQQAMEKSYNSAGKRTVILRPAFNTYAWRTGWALPAVFLVFSAGFVILCLVFLAAKNEEKDKALINSI